MVNNNIHSVFEGLEYFPKLTRTLNDPIYGQIGFEQKIWNVVDTRHYQRLRSLKQTGSVYFVYPGATHCRLEHSLGVGHLSSILLNQLLCTGTLFKEDYRASHFPVVLGAICHDLGHGPFSHLFDNMLIKSLDPNCKWKHEDGSVYILNDLIDKYHLDISREELKLASDIILGGDNNKQESWNTWKYEIVANQNNSLDVDKIDYICRDVYHLGISSSTINYNSLINGTKIIDDSLCYNVENTFEINFIYSSRYNLFKKVYTHKVVQAIDLMLRDCLIQADPVYKFLEKVNDVEEYLKLNDYILIDIEKSNDKRLSKSKEIMERIRKRDLYKCVGERLIQKENEKKILRKLTSQDLCNYQLMDGSGELNENDVEIFFYDINYGFGNKNPFDYIRFYQNVGDGMDGFKLELRIVKGKNSSYATGKCFKETYIRVFVKDKSKIELAKDAFSNFLTKNGINEGV